MTDKLDTGALAEILGSTPDDLALYELALTHGSTGRADYQRLEFLRVLRSHALEVISDPGGLVAPPLEDGMIGPQPMAAAPGADNG